MRLKVEQVYPGTPEPIALVTELSRQQMSQLTAGHILRCGGYRFEIVKVHGGKSANQLGLQLKSDFEMRPGMILRPSNAPLGDDELASMMMRATHILQTVCELDAQNVLDRLGKDSSTDLLRKHIAKEGTLEVTVAIFQAIANMKKELPVLAEQRKFGSMAETVNSQLSVMQLAGDKIATLGS